MQAPELYLPTLVPLWGIFAGIALVIIGFADKKASFTYAGWSIFMVIALFSAYYNLFGINPALYAENSPLRETATLLVKAGWMNLAGGALALVSLLFFYFKRRRYLLLATLTVLLFAIQFFQFYNLLQKPK